MSQDDDVHSLAALNAASGGKLTVDQLAMVEKRFEDYMRGHGIHPPVEGFRPDTLTVVAGTTPPSVHVPLPRYLQLLEIEKAAIAWRDAELAAIAGTISIAPVSAALILLAATLPSAPGGQAPPMRVGFPPRSVGLNDEQKKAQGL